MKRKQTPKTKSEKKTRTTPSKKETSSLREPQQAPEISSHLEQHILNFSRLSQNEKSSDIFHSALSLSFLHKKDQEGEGDGDTSREQAMYKTISFLSSFLTSERDEKSSITKAHVASLIFPWVTQSLIQKQDGSSPVIWKAFCFCLETLLRGKVTAVVSDSDVSSSRTGTGTHRLVLDSVLARILQETKEGVLLKSDIDANSKDTIATVLTQGTMNKLVPCFVRTAFKTPQSDTDTDEIMIIVAAKCFGLMTTSEFYRPTMDYVCNTLIPLLESTTMESDTDTSSTGIGTSILPNQAALLYLTIQLLITLQLKGRATNPKKTFQLVSSPQLLTSMARFCNVRVLGDYDVDIVYIVKKVVWFAIYDPHNHMDGFRSMNLEVPILDAEIQRQVEERKKGQKDLKKKKVTNSAHSCYQQALFSSTKTLIGDAAGKEDIYLFIPLLIEGFMCQSLEWDKIGEKNASRKQSRVDTTARVQFRFWSTLVYPMLDILKKTNESLDGSKMQSMLLSIQKCLALLLKFDAYLPSFADPGNQHLNYLTAAGEVLLSLAERRRGGPETTEYLRTFQHLFTLNHHIYHEKLSRLITCTANPSDSHQKSSSSELLCTLCCTYQKLRQLDHFVRNVLSCADNNLLSDGSDFKARSSFLHDASFLRALTSAIQNSPIGQTQEVWGLANQHILDSAKSANTEALVHSVDVFVIILKAVRVGPFSSKAIQELCEQTMATTVSALLGLNDGQDDSMSSGFDLTCAMTSCGLNLWGWIVHCHTKCCFWLNEMPHETVDEEGGGNNRMCDAKLIPVLLTSIKSILSSEHGGGTSLEALQLLACHRIQQLHSSIYQQQQLEGMSDTSGATHEGSLEMIEEVKLLVNFIVRCACSRAGGWKVICENLVNWIPYAETEHVDSFLRWFFFIQAIEDADRETERVRVPGLNEELPYTKYVEERAAAKALLLDASFFETPGLFQRVAPVGLSCATELLYHETPQIASTSMEELPQILGSRSSKKIEARFNCAREAASILSTLNLMISSCGDCEDTNLIFERALHIHTYTVECLRSCESSTLDNYQTGVRLVCICRELLSDSLRKMSVTNVDYMHQGESIVKSLLHDVFCSTKEILDFMRKADNESLLQFEPDILNSGSTVTLATVMYSIHSFDACKSHLEALVPAFEAALEGTTDSALLCYFNITMMRPSIQLLVNSKVSRTEKAFAFAVDEVILAVRQALKSFCVRYIHSKLCVDANIPSDEILPGYMYFVADLLAAEQVISKRRTGPAEDEDLQISVRQILDRTISLLGSSGAFTDDPMQVGILYIFGSIIGNDLVPSTRTLETKLKVQEIIMHQYKETKGRIHPLVDSSYAKVLSDTSAAEASVLASDLLTSLNESDGEDRISSLSAVLYCFHMMTHVVKGKSQRHILSPLARRLLPITFDLMHPFSQHLQVSYGSWSIQVRTAQGLIRTLIGKNDLILLKGCDVSNILATINTIFCEPLHLEDGPRNDERVYASSCAVVTSLLKHYPKQLYGCAPSFTSAMRSLLNHVMKSKREDDEGTKMIKEFRKVCELLPEHKDIFKKHIMHLVLYYIDGMQKSMDPWIKTQLEPSVFLLLDTLSEFETKQMNTLMRPTAKALFQSVFKNYQKHQYKGQF